LYFFAEAGKVGREDGWGNDVFVGEPRHDE
jgi:hypothetical protein